MKPVKIIGGNELVDALVGLNSPQKSAFIMIVRRSGPFIGLGVLEGGIAYLKCGPVEDSSALPMLRDVQPGDHFLLYPPRSNARTPNPPNFEQILSFLRDGAPSPFSVPSPARQTKPSSPHSGVSKDQLSEAVRPVLRRYVGPMTDVICDEAMERMPGLVPQNVCLKLVQDLASNLRDPKKSLEFTVAAEGLVKAMFD